MVKRKSKVFTNTDNNVWEPITPTQKILQQRLQGYANDVIALGVPGSGKTMVSINCALDALDAKKIGKVVLARPAEGTCEGLGYEKGSLSDKVMNWITPMLEVVESRYGKTHTQYMIDSGVIELLGLHQVTGRSFNNCWVLIDECQGINKATMNSLITRMGKYSKLVLMGDVRQKLLNKDSGITYLIELCDKYDMAFDIITFGLEDCVRSEKVKTRLKALIEEGVY